MDSNTPYYSPLAPSGFAAAATTTAAASPTPSPDKLPPKAVDSAEALLVITTAAATKADKGKKRLHYSNLITALKSTLCKVGNWTKKEEKKDERPRVRLDDITGETLDGWEMLR